MEYSLQMSSDIMADVFGMLDGNIRKIESAFGVKIVNRGEDIKITGGDTACAQAVKALTSLTAMAAKGEPITEQSVNYIIGMVGEGRDGYMRYMDADCIYITSRGKPVKPKSEGQKEYVDAIASSTVTIAIGPAGTARPTSQSRLPSPRCAAKKSAASLSPARPWKRGRSSVFCPATCRRKSIPTCVRSTTR